MELPEGREGMQVGWMELPGGKEGVLVGCLGALDGGVVLVGWVVVAED